VVVVVALLNWVLQVESLVVEQVEQVLFGLTVANGAVAAVA
jgi:hypothetical protein